MPQRNAPLFAAFSPRDGLFLSSLSPVCQRQCFHNSHRFPTLPAGHGGGGRKALFFLSVLTEAGTFPPASHPCRMACVAIVWLLAPLRSTPRATLHPCKVHRGHQPAQLSLPCRVGTQRLWLQHRSWGPGSNLTPVPGCQEPMQEYGTEPGGNTGL